MDFSHSLTEQDGLPLSYIFPDAMACKDDTSVWVKTPEDIITTTWGETNIS